MRKRLCCWSIERELLLILIKNCIAYSISSVPETGDRALSFSREVEFMGWFPVAFLTNGVFLKVTNGGIELTTSVLRVRVLNHYATTPLIMIRNINISTG